VQTLRFCSVTVSVVLAFAISSCFSAQAARAATVARCPFINDTTSLTREGLIYLRHAIGLRGAALVAGTGFSEIQATAASDVIVCPTCLPQLDINGDGTFDFNDAVVVARSIAGFRGASLTAGLASSGGSRPDALSQQHFVESGCSVSTPVVVLAAGDIAYCPSGAAASNAAQTAAALRRVPGVPVLTLGDNAYAEGTPAEFAGCFDPTWGVEKTRLRPSPGNHDYLTPDAAGYFGYFGSAAGPPGRGYYSFDVGDWHIISLNSNIDASAGSAQELWLRADLAATSRRCKLAYWHHPVFTSSPRGDNPKMKDIWQALSDFRATIILTGHEHNYERFAKQTATGVADPAGGIRQFIVGTGGLGMTPMPVPKPNSELRNPLNFGVLKLTLASGSYAWEFLPAVEGVIVDSGSASCN
jgi:acid phosphatase type 7